MLYVALVTDTLILHFNCYRDSQN